MRKHWWRSAGEQYPLNRAEGSVKKVDAAEVQAFRTPPPVPPRAEEPEEVLEPRPTFDYYLVNLPTNRVRPPRSLHLRFSHRYSISSFGIEVGLLRRVSFVTYRSPIPRRLGGPTIEMGPVFHLLQQDKRVPMSLSFRATVEGEDNFSERFTTNLVPVISRSIGNVAELYVVPTFNLGAPRRTLNSELPPGEFRRDVLPGDRRDLTSGELRNHQVSVGLGASIRIRPRTALIIEWRPRVAGFRRLVSRNTFAFGIQRSTNRHVFALTFSNTVSTTTTRSLTDGLDDLRIGFNLYRRLW